MSTIVKDILSGKEPRKRKLDQNIIRVGDRVKIINPEIVIRVGYPLSFEDGCKEIESSHSQNIIDFLNKIFPSKEISINALLDLGISSMSANYSKWPAYKKIVKALAYEYLDFRGFGGNERKIYTEVQQEFLGREFKVSEIFIRKTGIRYAPSGGYSSYDGEYDYEPGGLSKEKTHKILCLSHWYNRSKIIKNNFSNELCIEACNVQKIKENELDEQICTQRNILYERSRIT